MESKIQKYSEDNSGFWPLVSSGGWLIAVFNSPEDEEIGIIQRHFETDECFTLLEGSGDLLCATEINGNLEFESETMQRGIIYNIPKGVWHAHVLAAGSKILIVENNNTGPMNTVNRILTEQEKQKLLLLQ